MSYAGRIGKKDGVVVYIRKGQDLKVRPTIRIKYYAWNSKTMSNPGYGTKELTIKITFSQSRGKEEFAYIKGSGSGASNLTLGQELTCGRVICESYEMKGSDHRYNTVVIELNDNMCEKLNHTVSELTYSADVNDNGWVRDVVGTIEEEK